MDWLHVHGINFIDGIQHMFKGYDNVMLVLSHAGDPRNAFLLYFPLAYFCRPSIGVKVMWVAAISEWLNAVLKWVLHGERPYWWVKETKLYGDNPPHIQQYHLTCETGPGSPSGHAMVTASVCYLMISALIRHRFSDKGKLPSLCLWGLFLLFMVAVSVSRCFISTHFPHQVLFGTLVGILLAIGCEHLPTERYHLMHYLAAGSFLLISGPAIYHILEMLGYNPVWSVTLAQRWCAHKEWIYLDTTLFFALVRDSSSLMGLGFALQLEKRRESYIDTEDGTAKKHSKDYEFSYTYAILGSFLAILLARGSEYILLPKDPAMLFYTLSYTKYFLLPCVIVIIVSGVTCLVLHLFKCKAKQC